MEQGKRKISAEARARQLAGLSGVNVAKHTGIEIEKINCKGPGAAIPLDKQKEIMDLYAAGNTEKSIAAQTGLGLQTIQEFRIAKVDEDSQFRSIVHKQSMRQKLQTIAEGTASKLIELLDEMTPKDAMFALNIVSERLEKMDANKGVETLHQHLHIHSPQDINSFFEKALKPKE